MRILSSAATGLALLLSASASALEPQSGGHWLDLPLNNWNTPGMTLPVAPASNELAEAIAKRCQLRSPRDTIAERAVASASWLPFWHVDQQMIREDVEIVGGMRAADRGCLPAAYHLFVFVDGRFAGTLSPSSMSSGLDGAAGAVRLSPPLISAEFARYVADDPPCCPSSRVTVRYRIDRPPAGPVVVPVEIRTTRP